MWFLRKHLSLRPINLAADLVRQHPILVSLAVLLCVLASVLCSLLFGAVPISFAQLLAWFVGEADSQTAMILHALRLPRAMLAGSVGALLALSGTVTQGIFRNPLADPSLIGVSAGAALGASIMIVLFSHVDNSISGLSLVSIGAFLGGIVAVAFVYKLASGASGTSVATMLLAGIAITYMAGSVSSMFEFTANNDMLRRISLWRMGGLDAANYLRVLIVFSVLVIVCCVVPFFSGALNALLLGESEARHLGFNLNLTKAVLIACVALGVGVSVAMAGTITFIGLVVPHMMRMVVGPDHRALIPISAAAGACLLICADTLSRILVAPTELPVGLVTTFIGAPVFISLLKRRHEYGMR